MSFFRSKRNSIFTIIIFSIIILSFVIWGGSTMQGDSESPTVLTSVNGDEIQYQEFQGILARQLETYGQVFGGGKKMNDNLIKLVERQVASSLIMRKVLSQKANKLGIVIGDAEVLSLLEKNEAFHDEKLKRFSPGVYQMVLRANNLKPASFEKAIREELAANRMKDLLEQTVGVTDAEIREAYELDQSTMNLEVAVLDPAKAASNQKLQVSEAEIEDHYKKHQGEYLSSERRSGTFAHFTVSALESQAAISEDEIKKYFESTVKASTDDVWSSPQARALHILVSDTSPQGLKKATELKSKIKNEADFRKTAAAASEDFSNASNGGDLGYFGEKAMVKPFADAVFGNSNLRSTIGPVKTDFGYHLIWIADRTSKEKTLEGRKNQIQWILKQQKAEALINDLKAEVQKKLSESATADLSDYLKEKGFTLHEVMAFDAKTRDNQIPFSVLQQALKAPLNQWQGPEQNQKDLIVYRINQVNPPTTMPLEEAKPLISRRLESDLIEKRIRETVAKIKEGKATFASLKDLGATITSHSKFKRFRSQEIPGLGESEVLIKAAQELKPSSSVSVPLLWEGKWIVLSGSQWTKAPSEIPASEQARLKEEIASKKRTNLMESYTAELVKSAKIPKSFREKYQL